MEKQKPKSKRKRKARNVVIVVLIVIIAGTGVYIGFGSTKPTEAIASEEVRIMPLMKTTIQESISVSGAIYSASTKNVYTTENYPVKEVFVKTGDVVKAGDVLAELDISNVEYDIRQAENSLRSAEISASEDSKNQANTIQNAENSLASSKLTLDKQALNYGTLKAEYENGTSQELVNASNSIDSANDALESARKNLETKKNDYENKKFLYNGGTLSKNDLDAAEQAAEEAADSLAAAEKNYVQALDNYQRVKNSLAKNLSTAEKDLETAQINYKNAENSLTQAKSKASTSGISVENQELNLEKLREQAGRNKILAPIDGTITEVNATVGANPSGVLFVIEDMNDLYVSANVKEYDLASIAMGQPVQVTSDATGDQVLNGELSYISPKAVSEAGSTTVEFETHTQIQDKNPQLRIGMNAFIDIIIASRENVYAVPYTALNFGANGQSIYVMENNMVKEIPVETGLETAASVEITGDGLTDGMQVVLNPTAVAVGQTVDQVAGFGERRTLGDGETPWGGQRNGSPNGDASGTEQGQEGQYFRRQSPGGDVQGAPQDGFARPGGGGQ